MPSLPPSPPAFPVLTGSDLECDAAIRARILALSEEDQRRPLLRALRSDVVRAMCFNGFEDRLRKLIDDITDGTISRMSQIVVAVPVEFHRLSVELIAEGERIKRQELKARHSAVVTGQPVRA
jgi:hypothetical protein